MTERMHQVERLTLPEVIGRVDALARGEAEAMASVGASRVQRTCHKAASEAYANVLNLLRDIQ